MSTKRALAMHNTALLLVLSAVTSSFMLEPSFASPAGKYASEKIVYGFSGPDGAIPYGQLSFSGANLVGTTYDGGTGNQGTVFALTTKGQLTTLHNWTGGDLDGEYVTAGVVADAEGNLYGTTGYGGTSNVGIVYKLNTAGVLTILHSFSSCADGGFPIYGSLVLSQGVLYGVTSDGRLQSCQTLWGTAFQVNTEGSGYKVTYNFNNGADPKGGYNPVGAVALSNGSVFGTTQAGGGLGFGTVFQIDAAGKESALYSFKDTRSGATPAGGLILGKDGRFYGTTEQGGVKYQIGTVFVVDASGKQTVLHEFSGKHGDGAYPVAGLVQDAGGDLFGTTQQGGKGSGTVFEVTAAGTFITLHQFRGDPSDGQYPFTGLTIGPDGALYGTTEVGGPGGEGVVFKVTPNQ